MILNDEQGEDATVKEAEDEEDDVCGICRVAFEACCPACKTPGDDCPLSPSFFSFILSLNLDNLFLLQFGGNVHTSSICIACSNGSGPLRRRDSVLWTGENGVKKKFS